MRALSNTEINRIKALTENSVELTLIEPTETESKETLDAFCDALIQIAKEVEENPEITESSPAKETGKEKVGDSISVVMD